MNGVMLEHSVFLDVKLVGGWGESSVSVCVKWCTWIDEGTVYRVCLEVHIGCASWSLGRCLARGGGYVGQQVGKCVQSFVPSLNSPLFPKPPSERGSSSFEEGHVRSASVVAVR